MKPEGALRTGWQLAAGIAAYVLAFFGVQLGLSALFGKLFEAWGVTYENLHLAPRWAQVVVYVHADVVYGLAYAAGAIAALLLAKRWKDDDDRKAGSSWKWFTVGFALSVLIGVVTLVLDSMRLEYPLSEPAMSVMHLTALAVMVVGCISGEVLTKTIVFSAVMRKFGRLAGYAAAMLAALVLGGVWSSPIAVVAALFMTCAGCAVYERTGLKGSAAMNIGWTIATKWLIAVSGTSVYRIYSVSDEWLTGGNAGMIHGLAAVIGWGCFAAVLIMPELRRLLNTVRARRTKDGKDQDCNCGSRLQRR